MIDRCLISFFILVGAPLMNTPAAATQQAQPAVDIREQRGRGFIDAIKPLFPGSGAVDLGIPCLGGVPFDPELAARCDRGEAREEGRGLSTCGPVDELADKIMKTLEQMRKVSP